jgi:hypothetical protein
MGGRNRWRRVAVAMVVLGLLAGCGDDDATDATDRTEATDATDATDDTEATGGSPDAGSAGAAADRCPLSADQVSEALGAPVERDEASCTFFPADTFSPNATFVRQSSVACDEGYPADLGYEESLDGFGTEAYAQRDTTAGVQILVCDDAPFEVVVDIVGDPEAALAAAEQLARLVLDGA